MNKHTIESALARQELTEEEAYFILRFAGRLGYRKAIARLYPLFELRRWFIWVGGWENPLLMQWDEGYSAWEIFRNGRIQEPTPISFLGHRLTIQNRWLSICCFSGRLVISFPNNRIRTCWIYWSPDGTPSHPDAKILIKKLK